MPTTYLADGLLLSYRDLGSGPAIVLIHGWGATGDEWAQHGWIEALPGRRLLIPDVRGHGGSQGPLDVDGYDMRKLAGDIAALLSAADEEEADIFGYSMGGAIALWVAVSFHLRVRSLIVGAASGRDVESTKAMGRQLRGLEPLSDRARIYRDYAVASGAVDMESLALCMESGLPSPPCAELSVYGGEALLAAGDQDGRASFTEELAGCLPGGRFVLLEGADHLGGFGDPRLKDLVTSFLAETSPP